MDIILTDSAIRKFLETPASSEDLSQKVSLCGPTFDRTKKIEGDYIYEIEAITNRIDTASAQGVAREAATILSQFNIPAKLINDPYKDKPSFPEGHAKQFHFNIDKNLVSRFCAVSLENINVKPSPVDTQNFLENCEQRPINNCVDITNELTLLYGMPSHIFDLDKLAAQNLHVRESKEGEIVTTLDNQRNKLLGGDIVIEDGSHRLVDLCGVMGGQVAEVDDHTKNILLIVPIYSPKKVRKTSLAVQKRTLAAQLYEKQPDPELCLPVLSKAIQLFKERAGGKLSSNLYDFCPITRPAKTVSLNFNWLNSFVGIDLKKETVITILDDLGFSGSIEEDSLICSVPSWRYEDINLKEDLAEEVARIYGYFRLPAVLPSVNLPAEPKNQLLATELKAKKYLSNTGFHEVFNNSLVSKELLSKTEQDISKHLKLKNTLSSDFEYLRTSLTPSTLENLKHNQGKSEGSLEVYEMANCYIKTVDRELPEEVSTLSISSNGGYLKLKGQLEGLLDHLKVENVSFRPTVNQPSYFQQSNSVSVLSGNQEIGHLGQIKVSILRRLEIKGEVVATEINMSKLLPQIQTSNNYKPISEYPKVLEDITINSDGLVGDMIKTILGTSNLINDVQYLSSFQKKHTFRVTFGSQEKNLEQSEVNAIKENIQSYFQPKG